MNFTSAEDTARAMTATARWLPVLIQSPKPASWISA